MDEDGRILNTEFGGGRVKALVLGLLRCIGTGNRQELYMCFENITGAPWS